MTEEILINFTPQETRVAVMQQGVVQELHIERTTSRGLVGNVYLGRICRILPGMQSAFVDVGRAWGGDNVNAANPGWLGNVGMGLRIVSTRAAFSNVLHVDIAMPLNAAPDIKRWT